MGMSDKKRMGISDSSHKSEPPPLAADETLVDSSSSISQPPRRGSAQGAHVPPIIWSQLASSRGETVLGVSPAGMIEFLGGATGRMFTASAKDWQGKSLLDWAVPEDRLPLKAYLKNVAAGAALACISLRHPFDKAEDKRVEMTSIYVPDPIRGTALIWCLAWSATEVQPWARVFAHELKQPLAALMGSAQICQRLEKAGKSASKDFRESLERVVRLSEKSAELIDRLQSSLAPKIQQLAPTNVNDLVREGLSWLEKDFRQRHIRVEMQLAEKLPPVPADAVQLQRVIIHLLKNASEAMDEVPPAERTLTLSTRQEGSDVQVAVMDSGKGISAGLIEQIFQPLRSSKPGGMGIGLSMSRSIVQEHGGNIWARPLPGRGSVFIFSLPISGKGT